MKNIIRLLNCVELTTLHYTTLHYTTLHYTTYSCIILYFIKYIYNQSAQCLLCIFVSLGKIHYKSNFLIIKNPILQSNILGSRYTILNSEVNQNVNK